MDNKTERDSWDLDSGLPDDFDFYITSAEFGYLREYMDGEVLLLKWHGESPDAELDRPIIWPCGKGWESVKQGAEARHDKHTRFMANSIIGKMISRVVNELGVDMRSRGLATTATVWKGLGFHMKSEDIEYAGLMEERGGKTTHLMPTAVLGKVAKGKAKAKEVDSGNASSAAPSAPINLVLQKKLILLAAKLDKDEFQSKAMDMEDVVADDDLLAAILDDSEDGFWAKNHS